jgi:hypothetical protein
VNVLVAVFWLLAAWLGGTDDDPECLVLGGLDAARAQAFVSGDAQRLREVYVDAHAAGADIEMLHSYDERGLRLDGMLLVRESCRVVGRSERRLTLDVVDRLGPTTVRTADGHRRDLPRDRPTRRTVMLTMTADGWRVATVRED